MKALSIRVNKNNNSKEVFCAKRYRFNKAG